MNHVINLSKCIKYFIGLFAIVNPIGVIPIFVSLTNKYELKERNKINIITNFAVAIILFISLFIGNSILEVFGISIDSFRIAGGILIIMLAVSMITGKIGDRQEDNNSNTNNIAIVPLALPLMAGPGAISLTIVWSSRYHSWQNLLGFSLTIAVFSICCCLLFKIGHFMVTFLGKNGINIITRIIGLVLMSLGIESIITSIKSLFPCLIH
ncbi:YchE family NAAT transporter [Candidatus Ishikawella capsulata]|uniref:UPF0056 membrane protein n=1 Tax=Candidatus Ishikawaella capsulata Mpkobe TaxID=476281 RepID=C5WCN6_9ENTR|nr:YchE family NAAT transporter [Candidatus Ishikawaella capsulata]BAH83092.1 predicted inner membrane protein [Candidatus Ishikawaella capsulata Mpkobe]